MSPSATDSDDINRYRTEEINGFCNDDVASAETLLPSTAPSIPRSLRGIVLTVPPEKLKRVVMASAKGFSIGAGLKGGLALFAILARFARKKPPRWEKWKWLELEEVLICDCGNWFRFVCLFRKEVVLTNGEVIVASLKETLRYGLFLGTFAGTFVSMDELIGAFGGHRRHVFSFSLFNSDENQFIAFILSYCFWNVHKLRNCNSVFEVIQNSIAWIIAKHTKNCKLSHFICMCWLVILWCWNAVVWVTWFSVIEWLFYCFEYKKRFFFF